MAMTSQTIESLNAILKNLSSQLKGIFDNEFFLPDEKNEVTTWFEGEIENALFGKDVDVAKRKRYMIERLNESYTIECILDLQCSVYSFFGRNNRFSIRFDHQSRLRMSILFDVSSYCDLSAIDFYEKMKDIGYSGKRLETAVFIHSKTSSSQ